MKQPIMQMINLNFVYRIYRNADTSLVIMMVDKRTLSLHYDTKVEREEAIAQFLEDQKNSRFKVRVYDSYEQAMERH